MFIVISEFPDFDQTFLKFTMKSGCVFRYSNSFQALGWNCQAQDIAFAIEVLKKVLKLSVFVFRAIYLRNGRVLKHTSYSTPFTDTVLPYLTCE